MIEEVFMLSGCPHCGDGIPAMITIFLDDPPNIDEKNIHFGGFKDPKEAIHAFQSHRSLRIVACKPFEVIDEHANNQPRDSP